MLLSGRAASIDLARAVLFPNAMKHPVGPRFGTLVLVGLVAVASGGQVAAQDAAPTPPPDAAAAPDGPDLPAAQAPEAPPPSGQAFDGEAPSNVPVPREREPRRRRDKPGPLQWPPDRERRNEVYVIAGFGTPVGFNGFELVRRLGPVFEIAVGGGASLAVISTSKDSPFQWSVMPRLRLGEQLNAMVVGIGLSGGNYAAGPSFGADEESSGPPPSAPTQYTLWANFEAGGEHIARGGFAFRYFVGLTHGWPARGGVPLAGELLAFPYAGVGFGYAF